MIQFIVPPVVIVAAIFALKWQQHREAKIAWQREQRLKRAWQLARLHRINQERRRLNLRPLRFVEG